MNRIGCRVIYLPSRVKHYYRYKKRLKKVMMNTPYLAVWGNYSGLTNIDLMVYGKLYGVPMRIAHSHGSQLYWGSWFMKYVVFILHYMNKMRLCKYATHYWTCSSVSGRFMFSKNIWKKMTVIPNGVDINKFRYNAQIRDEVRKEFEFASDDIVVGHVARLCEVKNQHYLLKIFKEIVKQEPLAKCLLVGDGELRKELEETIKELQITRNVIMTGERSDIPRILNAMDVFVLTSMSEGLSVSAVEAQAVGLPCVLPMTVSRENDITGRVTFVSLDAGEEIWAKTIIDSARKGFKDTKIDIIEKGFDIISSSECLYRYFISGMDGVHE